MTLDRIFFAYMAAVGTAVGVAVTVWPQAREFRLQPYFWVLIAMVVFELAAYARGRGAPGTMLAMQARLLGFVLGIVLMVVIPHLLGVAAR